MTYKIENVPLPESAMGRKYPFREMKPGQSFAFDEKDRQRVACAAQGYGRRNGMKFATSGNRCYCVAKATGAQS